MTTSLQHGMSRKKNYTISYGDDLPIPIPPKYYVLETDEDMKLVSKNVQSLYIKFLILLQNNLIQ